MVKHNNVVPNVHLRKHWQRNVTVWLNQASRKRRRLIARRSKARLAAPRPIDKLRPIVRGQTIRYNNKTREGKGTEKDNLGFTLEEIKAAGLGVAFARSVGIAVDHRRQNRCQESLDLNRKRLQAYVSKLVLYPRHEKTLVTKAKSGIINDSSKESHKVSDKPQANTALPLIRRVKSLSTGEVNKLKKDKVFRMLRQEWANQRWNGKRLNKASNPETKKK